MGSSWLIGGILKDPSDLTGFLKSYHLWGPLQAVSHQYLGYGLLGHCGSPPHLLLTEHGKGGFVKLPLALSLLDLAEVLVGPCIIRKTRCISS